MIDKYLKSLKLPLIQIRENRYSLKFTADESHFLFKHINLLTPEQRSNYLFIKIFLFGFLNLESEREFLDVSRSTINRDFSLVKEELESSDFIINYRHSKGIFIEKRGSNLNFVLYTRFLNLIAQEEFLPQNLKFFINSLFPISKKEFFILLHQIFQRNGLKVGEMIFYLICSYLIIFTHVDDFFFHSLELKLPHLRKNNPDFNRIFQEIYSSNPVFEKVKLSEYITEALLFLKNGKNQENILLEYHEQLFFELKNVFNMKEIISDKKRDRILTDMNSAMIKSIGNVIEANYCGLTSEDEKFYAFLYEIFKRIGLNLTYSNMVVFSQYLKKILIEDFLSEDFHLLILVGKFSVVDIDKLKRRLEFISPNIVPYFQTHFYHEYLMDSDDREYDLIISDFSIRPLYDERIIKLKDLDSFQLESTIKESCFQKIIERVKTF